MTQVQDRVLQTYTEILQVTEALASLADGQLTEGEDTDNLHVLLAKRQQLITRASGFVKHAPDENLNHEIRFILEKITSLDTVVRKKLLEKRDEAKSNLQRIHTGKQAGRAYNSPQQQTEGFFIDTRKN